MSDDLFSQLFNLFNNDDDDVNWQLAEQINNHINKDVEEDRLLSNSGLNYQEIFRVIELSQESSTKNEYTPLEVAIMDSKNYYLVILEKNLYYSIYYYLMLDIIYQIYYFL